MTQGSRKQYVVATPGLRVGCAGGCLDRPTILQILPRAFYR